MRSRNEHRGGSQLTKPALSPYMKKGETFYPESRRVNRTQTPLPTYGNADPSNVLPGYVHQSWTDVIPPNGVKGHPNLLVDGTDRGIARPFSAAVRIRKPTEADSLSIKPTIISKGSSNGVPSQEFKPSLQPTGLSKFVSEAERSYNSSLSFADSRFTRLPLMNPCGREAFRSLLRLSDLRRHLRMFHTVIIVISCHPVWR